jgi:hypothetical protein
MDTDRIILLATLFVPTKTQRLAALQKQNTLTPAQHVTSDVLNREKEISSPKKQEISSPKIPSIYENPSSITVFKISRHRTNLADISLYSLKYYKKVQHYTIFFITVNVVHVSGGFLAHHQELKTVHTESFIYLREINLLHTLVASDFPPIHEIYVALSGLK